MMVFYLIGESGTSGSKPKLAQCLASLAYSYSQLLKLPETAVYFHQAYQVAQSIGDLKLSWQAAEGYACAALGQNKTDEAQQWFYEALAILQRSPDVTVMTI